MVTTKTALTRINSIISTIEMFSNRILTDLSAYNYDSNLTNTAKEHKTLLSNIVAQLRSIAKSVETRGADAFPNLGVLLNWYTDYAHGLERNLPFRVKLADLPTADSK